MLYQVWKCIRGVRLYKIYGTRPNEQSQAYCQNLLESSSQQVITGVTVLANIGLYVSPMILLYMWRRDYTLHMAVLSVAKFTAGFTLLVLVAMVVRGLGRALNPVYTKFLTDINSFKTLEIENSKTFSVLTKHYDCDFEAVPVTYSVQERKREFRVSSFVRNYLTPGGLAAHMLGRLLIYPGSVLLLQAALRPHLEEGRDKLITSSNATRAKVRTADANYIDTVFVDRRHRGTGAGKTLVICCEGNAGFYEVGIMVTPMDAGFSVLGWNMPGFAYSTGQPFPDQVEAAVDAVMQFALNMLEFAPDNIIVYGWSIGGYPAAWLAANYPDIRGLVLDATFDHVLPLALPRMPALLAPIVESSITGHFNLCVAELAARFFGPLTIIRRRDDEIITTVEGDVTTNRANDLLEMILLSRYPYLFSRASHDALRSFIAAASDQEHVRALQSVDADHCLAVLRSLLLHEVPSFPSSLGENLDDDDKVQLLLYLASKMFLDVEGGHPQPLPAKHFKYPWSLVADSSFEQVE